MPEQRLKSLTFPGIKPEQQEIKIPPLAGNQTRTASLEGRDSTDYADVSMSGENLQTIRENTDVFIKASKDIGLELNSEKTKYMITSRQQNIEQNQNIVFENLVFRAVRRKFTDHQGKYRNLHKSKQGHWFRGKF